MISSLSQVGHFLAPEILLEKEKSCSQLKLSHALFSAQILYIYLALAVGEYPFLPRIAQHLPV